MNEQRRRYWSKLIAEQKASGQKLRSFCRERGIGEWSFYRWRRRLQQAGVVEFALLETATSGAVISDSALELVLQNGERLRIANGVEAGTLRLVLDAVRS